MAFALVSTACADSIYLNPLGRENLDVLRARIAPAPIFDDEQRQLPYIRCTIVGERPARNPSAPFNTPEGRPEYDIVAFDATGDQRSAIVTINAAWIHHIDVDYDSDLDVRMLFSDRDRLAGVPLGSRTYFAMARRAADPHGRLGLWRNDLALPAEPAGVNEGSVIRFLLDPPVFDESGRADNWSERKQAEALEAAKVIMSRRLPSVHVSHIDARPSLMVPKLIDAIARERAFRLSHAGFDRTALGMLVFLLDLATVPRTESLSGENPLDMIHDEGVRGVVSAVEAISAATPMTPAHMDPPELIALMHDYRAATDDTQRATLAAEYDTLQDRVAPPGRTSCRQHRQFCVDSSQIAAAAIDALAASDGVYVKNNYWRILAESLVHLHITPEGPNPHKYDRIDLRDASFRLLAQLINPPSSPISARQQLRQEGALEMRRAVYGILVDHRWDDAWDEVAHRALAAGSWGSAAELDEFVETMLAITEGSAERIARHDDAETRSWSEPTLVRHMKSLRRVAELAASEVEHERAAAARILDRVNKKREEQRESLKSGHGILRLAVFLEAWDNPPAP